jgi:hypothetical protein
MSFINNVAQHIAFTDSNTDIATQKRTQINPGIKIMKIRHPLLASPSLYNSPTIVDMLGLKNPVPMINDSPRKKNE